MAAMFVLLISPPTLVEHPREKVWINGEGGKLSFIPEERIALLWIFCFLRSARFLRRLLAETSLDRTARFHQLWS